MEYCEGTFFNSTKILIESDLSFHIKGKRAKNEEIPEIVILNWFVQIAFALDYIH